jgi:hypothetical protein
VSKVANVTHPLISQLMRRKQRGMREAFARVRFAKLAALFVISRKGRTPEQFTMWIRGYMVSAKEQEAGYLGHFAVCRLQQQQDQWRIVLRKEHVPLEQHPERVRAQTNLPNWGYPVMRSIKNQRVFASEWEAKAQLDMLSAAFPKACNVRAEGLSVRVYGKHPEFGAVLEWLLVKIQPAPDAFGWVLHSIVDPASPAKKLRQREERLESDEAVTGTPGEFARKVMAGKKRPAAMPGAVNLKERRAEAVKKALRSGENAAS